MNLSREAIITLRPPSPDSNSTTDWNSPTVSWLSGRWYITHSTLPSRTNQKNVRVSLNFSSSGECIATWSHEDVSTQTVTSSTATNQPLDFNPADKTASTFQDAELHRTWQVLAWGKEGQLVDWMIDDGDGWISDSSGERRADWRNSYVVVRVSGEGESGKEGIEIWDRWATWKPLSGETVAKIGNALREQGVGRDRLVKVGVDGGRD